MSSSGDGCCVLPLKASSAFLLWLLGCVPAVLQVLGILAAWDFILQRVSKHPLNFCKGGECGRCEEPAAGKGLCSPDPQEQSLQHLCLMHRTSLSNFFLPVLSWGMKRGCKASVCFPCVQRGCSRGSLSCGGPCSWALRAPGAASPCLGGSRAWGLASGAAAAGSGSAVLVVLLHVGGLCKPWHRRPRARG